MKKNKMISIVSLLGAISLFTTGCVTTPTKGALSTRVKNFAVKATDTVEIGQYYIPDVPNATLDGKHTYVGIEATQGENKLFFNGDNQLLVESFDDITITYTIAEGDQKLTKTTTVSVQDTTKPYIVANLLPDAVYRGRAFAYEKYIRVGDLSGKLSESEIVVTDQDGEQIDTQNGVLTLAEDSPVQEVKFLVSAKDGKGNEAAQVFTLPVLDSAYWNKPVDFDKLKLNSFAATGAGMTLEAVEKEGGEKALKISVNRAYAGKTTKANTLFQFTEAISEYTCFDYIKMQVSVQANCDVEIWKTKSGGKFKKGDVESEKTELIYDMQNIRDKNSNVVSGNNFQLSLVLCEGRLEKDPPENIEVEFYVYSFEFGYNEREVLDNRPIDVSEFGFAQSEVLEATFTNVVGDSEEIELESWIPKKGTLTITLKKSKYRKTTIEIPIKTVSDLVNNGSDYDTDVEYDW